MTAAHDSRTRRATWESYAVAGLAVLAASALRVAFTPLLGDRLPLLFFLLAVASAAFHGGFLPAIVSMVLGAFVLNVFFLGPVGSFSISSVEEGLPLAFFGFSSIALAIMGELMHRAARRERERAEALHDSNTHLRLAMHAALAIAFEWNIRTDRVRRLQSVESALPETDGQFDTFEGVARVVHPEDRPRFRANVDAALKSPDGRYSSEFRIVRPDGEVRWLCEEGRVEFDRDRKPLRLVGISQDITARKVAEIRARESEQFVRAVLDSLPEHVVLLDEHGVVKVVNEPWERFARENGGDLRAVSVGANYLEICRRASAEGHPYAREALEGLEAVLRGNRNEFVFEYPCDAPGRQRWFLMYAKRPVQQRPGVIVSHLDMTARKMAEDQIRQNQETLASLLNNTPALTGIVELAEDFSDILHVMDNVASERFFGVPRGGTTGRWSIADLNAAPETVRQWCAAYSQARKYHAPVRFASEIVTAHGVVWLDVSVSYVGPGQHGRDRFCYTAIDDTERKRAEEELRASEERFRTMAETVPSVLFTSAPDGTSDYTNRWFYQYTGVPENAANGLGWSSTLHPDDATRAKASWLESMKSGQPWTSTHRLRRADGEYRWFTARAMPVRDSHGQIVKWIGAVSDIHDLVTTQEALRESEGRYRALASHLPGGAAFIVDQNLRYQAAEGEALQEAGFNSGTFVGKTIHEALEPSLATAYEPHYRRALEGQPFMHEHKSHGRYYMTRGVPLRDHFGKVTSVLAVSYDITARKEAEETLRAAKAALEEANRGLEETVQQRTAQLRQTVQQLETFSYSIVHDMRAPLRSMRSFAAFLEQEYGDKLDELGRKYIERIVTSAARMDALITDVLNYSRVTTSDAVLHNVNVERLLREILTTYPQFQDLAGAIHVEKPLSPVIGNTALLTQVLSNLIGNALKFVPKDVAPEVHIRSERHGEYVRVWVEDNGIGIPAEHAGKIFGLFQRLHGPDKYPGTGVGLAIVKAAIERMHGTVGVESTPGQGSRFWFELRSATAGEA